jgi:hypothetical protein
MIGTGRVPAPRFGIDSLLRLVAEQVTIHPAHAVGRPAPAVECPALVPEEVLRAALVSAVDMT